MRFVVGASLAIDLAVFCDVLIVVCVVLVELFETGLPVVTVELLIVRFVNEFPKAVRLVVDGLSTSLLAFIA